MTLKTFHFAGVASMNVTLGVPRIKEIVNGARNISTPIITAELQNATDVRSARIVKGRVEKTPLGGVCKSVAIVISRDAPYVRLVLDLEAIDALQLNVDVELVVKLLTAGHPKLRGIGVQRVDSQTIHVAPGMSRRQQPASTAGPGASLLWFELQQLKATLMGMIVCGIPSVERAVINEKQAEGEDKTKCYKLLVEGTGLTAVMGTPGVDGTNTTSNHVLEVEKTLGIEAARQTIISEINYTMGQHGMDIDTRHIQLLADVMTSQGEVLGITRFGVAKMRSSVLMLASFERTTDHLFAAAAAAQRDAISGVSEAIIMGQPIALGSGLFKLLQCDDDKQVPTTRKKPGEAKMMRKCTGELDPLLTRRARAQRSSRAAHS